MIPAPCTFVEQRRLYLAVYLIIYLAFLMEASLQHRLRNYICALEILVKTGEPEPNVTVALGCIVVR